MPRTMKAEQVDQLMEQASEALTHMRYFEAEQLADRALGLARMSNDFERMARICLPLQEARRQRLLLALEAGEANGVTIVTAPPGEAPPAPGCYLFQPPLVGADCRRFRLAALAAQVPVAALCREPRTQLGLCPIVAIGQTTVRQRIEEPEDPAHPSMAWFVGAMEQLGDAAIESVDPGLDIDRQIDAVLARLDAVPDHEKLHQLLESLCHRAAVEFAANPRRAGSRQAANESDDEDPELDDDGGLDEAD